LRGRWVVSSIQFLVLHVCAAIIRGLPKGTTAGCAPSRLAEYNAAPANSKTIRSGSMVFSMTAFARSDLSTDQGNLAWELRSVNHPYLGAALRLPDAFRDLEGPLRERLRKQLARGKVECTLRFNPVTDAHPDLSLNQPLLDQLIEAAGRIRGQLDNPAPINPLELLAWPGVLGGSE